MHASILCKIYTHTCSLEDALNGQHNVAVRNLLLFGSGFFGHFGGRRKNWNVGKSEGARILLSVTVVGRLFAKGMAGNLTSVARLVCACDDVVVS